MSRKRKVHRKFKNTVTPKKLAANQQNAQKSGGPTSKEGQAVSAQNAETHGAFSLNRSFMPGEDPALFAVFEAMKLAEYTPVGDAERHYANRAIWEEWKLDQRFEKRETDMAQAIDNIVQREHELSKVEMTRQRVLRTMNQYCKKLKTLQDARKAEAAQADKARAKAPELPDHMVAVGREYLRMLQLRAMPEYSQKAPEEMKAYLDIQFRVLYEMALTVIDTEYIPSKSPVDLHQATAGYYHAPVVVRTRYDHGSNITGVRDVEVRHPINAPGKVPNQPAVSIPGVTQGQNLGLFRQMLEETPSPMKPERQT